jgi:hypothetical protein
MTKGFRLKKPLPPEVDRKLFVTLVSRIFTLARTLEYSGLNVDERGMQNSFVNYHCRTKQL